MKSFLLMVGGLVLAIAIVRGYAFQMSFDDERPKTATVKKVVTVNGQTIKMSSSAPKRNGKIIWADEITGPASYTKEDAWKGACEKVARTLADHFHLKNELSVKEVEERLIVDRGETILSLGKDSNGQELPDGVQVTLRVQLRDDFAKELAKNERESAVEDRMTIAGKLLGGLVAGLLFIAGCLRLDDWSKGYFSGVIKVIAVIATVAGGIAAYVTLVD